MYEIDARWVVLAVKLQLHLFYCRITFNSLSWPQVSLTFLLQKASSSSCHPMKSSHRSAWMTSENHSLINCTTGEDGEVWMMTCRVYGFTTGLMHSGNAFISIWAHTPTSSPPLTQWHTWERNRATTRTHTTMTPAICATAFSADTSTPRRSTLPSSACALALWVLTSLCPQTFFF